MSENEIKTAAISLEEGVNLILDAASISCDSVDSPFAAGFIAALECLLSADETPAYDLVAEAIGCRSAQQAESAKTRSDI